MDSILDNQQISIYTDGSCHTVLKTGGWASIIIVEGEKLLLKGLVPDTSHQRMELLAVIESLAYIISNKLDRYSIIVYTDSQYVKGLGERRTKLEARGFLTRKHDLIRNADLVKKIITYIKVLDVSFIKIKAHQKTTLAQDYNREVDKLARQIIRQHIAATNDLIS
jgi:ribonuclease HI